MAKTKISSWVLAPVGVLLVAAVLVGILAPDPAPYRFLDGYKVREETTNTHAHQSIQTYWLEGDFDSRAAMMKKELSGSWSYSSLGIYYSRPSFSVTMYNTPESEVPVALKNLEHSGKLIQVVCTSTEQPNLVDRVRRKLSGVLHL